jgi:1,4-alpha-glucan branching enzyme
MIHCEPNKGNDQVTVTFILDEDGIDGQVAVVGDFNGWDPTATLLRKHGAQRKASITLETGRRYAFRYLAEGGRWFNDEAADDYQPNEHGGSDSVVDLSAKP